MNTPTPRWEWRTFGTAFGGADACIHDVASTSRATRELYLVSDASDADVKVRDEAIAVKLPIAVDANGLARWSPTVRAEFPLEAAAIGAVFAAWNLPIPALNRASYDLDAFLVELVLPQAALTPVSVVTQRREGLLDRCRVEVTDIWIEGHPLRSLAVETSDPQEVLRTVRALGLAPDENVSYVAALRQHVAMHGRHVHLPAQQARLHPHPHLDGRTYV